MRSPLIITSRRVFPTNPFVEFSRDEINQSITNRFEQQVNKVPDRPAVKTERIQFSYTELNQYANGIARAILDRRGEGEEPIALLLDMGAPLIAVILGVLKAGKSYVSLDPSFPAPWNTSMIEDAQPGLILTDTHHKSLAMNLAHNVMEVLTIDEVSSRFRSENLDLTIPPDTIASILYTSGSAGQPKGVYQNHRNILHNSMNYTNGLHIASDDRLSLLSSCSFGASVSDIFGALLNGATLFPFNLREEGMIQLASWLTREEITIYHSVPTVYRHFLATLTGDEKFPKLRLIKLGGEAVQRRDVELYRKHFHKGCIFHVGFGATEMNIIRQFFCDHETTLSGPMVPVGYAVEGTEVLVLDDRGKEVGYNCAGEMVIKSKYLALGYWRKEDLTKAAFLPDPQGGSERLYRTGDLGYLLPDGCLFHLGRKDFQVKIRGYRVEVNEIETALNEIAPIKGAVIAELEDQDSSKLLVAYVVLHQGEVLTASELRNSLKDKLPDYMIPSHVIFLDALPLTPNGKVDRNALIAYGADKPRLSPPLRVPRNPIEKRLVEIWTALFKLEHVGIDDNFFDLGGHSLKAIDMCSRIEKEYGKRISPSLLIQAPTIEQLAAVIADDQIAESLSCFIPLRPPGSRPPLFCFSPITGDVLPYRGLVKYLDPAQSVYGVNSSERVLSSSLEETAAYYVSEIRKQFPEGPLCLAGYSSGGIMAFETARQLHALGHDVAFLALLDTVCPIDAGREIPLWDPGAVIDFLVNLPFWLYYYLLASDRRIFKLKILLRRIFGLRVDNHPMVQKVIHWSRNYVPKFYDGHVVFYASKVKLKSFPLHKAWRKYCKKMNVSVIPGYHEEMLKEPYVRVLARNINAELQNINQNSNK